MAIIKLLSKNLVKERVLKLLADRVSLKKSQGKSTAYEEKEIERVRDA